MVALTNIERPRPLIGESTSTSQPIGELHFSLASQGAGRGGSTESEFPTGQQPLDEQARGSILAHIDYILDILEREIAKAAYFEQLRAWSRELRNEIKTEPKVVRVAPEHLYDDLYRELVELERRRL